MADESITVVKVRDVLMVTLPADPDDASVSALQMKVLQMMEQYDATGLVLDISAVETLDSFFARTVEETAQMAALMGGRTVIAGMRPSVAITATQLGLTLGRTMTALDVDRALDTLTDARQRGQ
jgi:rsbT antagonist protein RsbS